MPENYIYGDPVKLPSPIKDGHSFIGWFLDQKLTKKFVFDESTGGDLTLYSGYKKGTSLQTQRNLAKPYVVCGKYAASLISGERDGDIMNAVIDGPNAWQDIINGTEYIADHNYQGGSAFTYNNRLAIVRSNGTTEYYAKVGSYSWYWEPGLDLIDTVTAHGGQLVTQTCVGDYVYFYMWEKE